MANIFTRKALNEIMDNEELTPEQKTEQVFALYGRALDDGYIAKAAAKLAQEAAVEAAKADWEKGQTAPDPKESDEYKALLGDFDAYKAMQAARTSKDFEGVKPKFFETVYGLVDRAEGAKPLQEQLAGIREQYEEYFTPADPNPTPGKLAPEGGAAHGGQPRPRREADPGRGHEEGECRGAGGHLSNRQVSRFESEEIGVRSEE